MNVVKEIIDDVNIIVRINIEKADYQEAVEKELKDYRKNAVIPGFRPGKVPPGLVRQKVGKAILVEEINKLLSKSLSEFIVNEKLPVLGEPLPNEETQKPIDFDKDENFEFAYDIGLAPEIKVTLDKRSQYDFYLIKVDDEMIDRQVNSIAYQYGSNLPKDEVTEKSNVRGDFAQLGNDGQILEGGISPEGVLLAVNLIKDETIKSSFIGKKQGDEIIFDPVKAFGDRHEVGHMLNIKHEEADDLNSEFRFTVKEITEFIPAEVDDNLVKLVFGEESETKTVEQFRSKVSEDIAASLRQSSEYKFALDTRDALVGKTKFNLPEAFLKRWLTLKNEKLTKEQIDSEFDDFLKGLRWQVITEKIIKDNDIRVSEEEAMDLARQVTLSQFRQYGISNVPAEQLDSYAKMMIEKEDDRQRIYEKLYENKIMKIVQEKTSIKEKEVTSDEFNAMMN